MFERSFVRLLRLFVFLAAPLLSRSGAGLAKVEFVEIRDETYPYSSQSGTCQVHERVDHPHHRHYFHQFQQLWCYDLVRD